jgi:hemolysin activation/secretion protein
MKLPNPYAFNAIALLLFGSVAASIQAAPPVPITPQIQQQINNAQRQSEPSGLLMRETSKSPVIPQKESEAIIENATEQQRPPMQPQNDLRVTVQYFSFSGNSHFSNNELQALLTKYKGHPIGFNDLQAAANEITEFYRQAGYLIAHAYLPAQSIKNGTVEIVILEGRLDGSHLDGNHIEFIGDTRINKSTLQRFLDTHKEGETITDADLSRLSLMVNDLPGIESKAVLAPGTRTGTSALSLKVKEGPLLSGYVSADNHGLYSTGYYRFDTGININDPFGLGDQLSLRAQSTETGNSVAGWADYNVPINGYGTRLGLNFSELHYELGRSFKPLEADGIARTVGASLIHPLYLSREARLTGVGHYEHRWLQDNINLVDTHNDRELNVMSFSLAGSLYDKLLPAGGLTQAFLNVSAGEVYFTNQVAALLDNTSGLNSNGGYHKFNWQLNRTQNIWGDPSVGDISLYANFNGQVASKNLDSSEQISLGGPNAIRAYPVGEGSADEGWIFNGEARYSLPSFSAVPGQIQFISFIDTGFSRINANPLDGQIVNSRNLTGYGFGINWLGVAGFNLRTSLAWRDVSAQPTSDPSINKNAPQGYFQLTKTF